jgi:hypothetical protein
MLFVEFDARLSAVLKTLPNRTVADLTDEMIAWWDGSRTVYASTALETHEYPLAENWDRFSDWLRAWLDEPRFSVLSL